MMVQLAQEGAEGLHLGIAKVNVTPIRAAGSGTAGPENLVKAALSA